MSATKRAIPVTWFTVHEAATYARRHYKTVLYALQEGSLKGSQRGARRRWSVHRDDLDRWIRGEAPKRGAIRRVA